MTRKQIAALLSQAREAAKSKEPGAPSLQWFRTFETALTESVVVDKSMPSAEIADALESLFAQSKSFVGVLNVKGSLIASNQDWKTDERRLSDFGDEVAEQRAAIVSQVLTTQSAYSRHVVKRTPEGTKHFRHQLDVVSQSTEEDGNAFVSWVILDVTNEVEAQDRMMEARRRRSLEILAGGVAHDFNNLLTAILGNTTSVLEDLSEDSQFRAPLDDVRRSSVRAARLSRQLLAFSGKTGNELLPVDLVDVTTDLKSAIASSLPTSTTLHWEIATKAIPVRIDRAQIQHVALQIILNASEALEGEIGNVTVEVKVDELDDVDLQSMVRSEGLLPGTYALMCVTDTGHGMDDDTRQRMFDPFFTTRFTGRGMGLAACAGITRAHNGGISVKSDPLTGTTINITLPIAVHDVEESEATPLPQGDGTGKRILVVDDEAVVLRFTERALKKFGYDVVVVSSGAEALEVYSAGKFDLVLLDMTMPEMNGEQTFLKLLEIDEDVATILVSGYNAVEATRRFTSAGLAGFLEKPYSARKLAAKVEAVVRQTRSGPSNE